MYVVQKTVDTKWLLLSWFLHKLKWEFSDTSLEMGKTLPMFQLNASLGRK